MTRAENKVFKPVKSMVERHVETFKKLGFNVDLSHPEFPEKAILFDEIIKISNEKLNNNWIGIAPFAQYQTKVYPPDMMQKVVDELASDSKNKIFLFGGGNKEIEILNQFSKDRQM